MKVTTDKNTGQNIMTLGYKFRWPVEQINENEVIVKVPVARGGTEIVAVTPGAIDTFELTDKEVSKASEAANEAAIRALAIIE